MQAQIGSLKQKIGHKSLPLGKAFATPFPRGKELIHGFPSQGKELMVGFPYEGEPNGGEVLWVAFANMEALGKGTSNPKR